MKKQILTIVAVILIAIGSTTIIGCGNAENKETGHTEHMEGEEHTIYQCPMKCEGDKTYTEEGSCPVCGMDLKEVE